MAGRDERAGRHDLAAEGFTSAARSSMRFRAKLEYLERAVAVLWGSGRPAAAAELCARLAAMRPDHVPTLKRLAICRAESGRPVEALDAITRAMRLNPYSIMLVDECRRQLGGGDLARADARIDLVARARGLGGADVAFLRALARWGRGMGRAAADEFSRARPSDCSLGFVTLHRARLHSELGETSLAFDLASRHLREHPRHAEAYRQRAGILLRAGIIDGRAIDDLRQAVRLNPGIRDVVFELAFELYRGGSLEEALAVLEANRSGGPEVTKERFLLHAVLLARGGDREGARAVIEKACTLLPEHANLFRAEAGKLGL